MKKLIFLGLLLFLTNPLMGEVTSWVNKNPVKVGDLFQLHVEAKNVDDPQEPDLSRIKGLQILNRSVQNKTSIVGTSFTSTVSWSYVLIAPDAGEYLIPPLKIGNEKTAPILLKAVESTSKSKQDVVQLEVIAEPKKVYPQQQVLVRIRIIRSGIELENETITPLEPAGAHVEKVHQTTHQTFKNGKKQIITEITYAVFAEKSGTLIIPQLRYHGDKRQGGTTQRNFGNFGNLLKTRGQRIFSTSEPQTIEVQSLPKQNTGWWLPAKEVKVNQQWQPDPPVFKVGEPVTRTVTIIADGVSGNQIPELSFQFPDTLKGYADQPQIETQQTPKGLKGIRKEKWALIPSQPGEITLPKISVSWWDVTKNQFRTAIIPSKVIQVHPVSKSSKENISQKAADTQKNKSTAVVAQNTADANNSANLWKVLTIGFAMLWAGTIMIWIVSKNRKTNKEVSIENNFKQKQQVEIKSAAKNVEQALCRGEPVAVQSALLKWGNSVWTDDPPDGLEQIGERIPELKNGIKSLNSALYGNHQNGKSLNVLKDEFIAISSTAMKIKNSEKESNLPPLYPE